MSVDEISRIIQSLDSLSAQVRDNSDKHWIAHDKLAMRVDELTVAQAEHRAYMRGRNDEQRDFVKDGYGHAVSAGKDKATIASNKYFLWLIIAQIFGVVTWIFQSGGAK